MPVPTHDITCNTKAFQTGCPSCNAEVWFFACSCGSKVFFDRLGHPWEPHECLEYRLEREITLIKNIDRLTENEIYDIILKHEKRSGVDIDDKVWGIIEHTLGKRKTKMTTETVQPMDSMTEVSGRVMEVNGKMNIFKRLGYDANNEISRKLLGEIGSHQWAYARIRSNPDRKNHCLEFEVIFKESYLQSNTMRKDDMIVGIARPLSHRKGTEWELIKHDRY